MIREQKAGPLKKSSVMSRGFLILIIMTIALIILPLIFRSGFALSLFNSIFIAIILAMSLNMLFGQCGLLSFGHAVFFGLGAFFSIHALKIIEQWNLFFPIFMVPLIGGIGGLIFGIIFGSFSTKKPGVTFALLTIGLGELVHAAAIIPNPFFGGDEGIRANRVTGLKIFSIDFASQREVYYLIIAWTILCIVLMYAFTRTPLGRMANAVRDNPERVEFIGYNPLIIRFLVFSLAGFFAGIGGGLFAINYEVVTFDTFGIHYSSSMILMAYMGGIGYFYGPILGAILYTVLSMALSDYTKAWLLYLGIFFTIFVMYVPGGIANILNLHWPILKQRRLHKLIKPYVIAFIPGVILTAGTIAFIEISYKLAFATKGREAIVNLWGFHFNASAPWPRIAAIIVMGIGFYFLYRAFPIVRREWQLVNKIVREESGVIV